MNKNYEYDGIYVDREEKSVIGAIGKTEDNKIYITFSGSLASGLYLYNKDFDLLDVIFNENRTIRKTPKWK